MGELYLGLKWLHVVGACIGFGSNVTHFFWLLSANVDEQSGAEKIRVVKRIDDLLSVPAYSITIVCGAVMWLTRWPTNTSWIIISLIVSIILAIMGIAFGPFMHKWIRLAGDHAPGQGQLGPMARRLTLWWAGIVATGFVIFYLMIAKPVYW